MSNGDVILILTASAGAGHNIAAGALAHEFRVQAPAADVIVLDVLAISNGFFRRLYADGYLGLVRYAPTAMGWLYDAMDQPGRRIRNALRILIQDLNKLPTTRFVRQHRPRLIVNTHYLPAEFVAQMRHHHQLDCPQVTVTTDFETHRLWVQEPTERYYTATTLGKAYLSTWGVNPERVVVSGIPVRPGFVNAVARAEARRRCQLPEGRPVVLLLSGGFGVGPTGALLRELVTMPTAANIVVVAGRNTALKRRLEAQVAKSAASVRVLGYVENMHEWMAAADVVVSKPGGLTVAEALACGVPLMIVNPIPGQETRNADYLLEQGAAQKVNNPRLLGHRVSTLLSDPAALAAFQAAARRTGRPNAAREIVADALRLL